MTDNLIVTVKTLRPPIESDPVEIVDRVKVIRDNVGSNAQWACRAILVLYYRQTESEQAMEQTTVKNGVGFTGFDAKILTSFATRLLSGRSLTEKQTAVAFRRLPKYATQLYNLSRYATAQTVQ